MRCRATPASDLFQRFRRDPAGARILASAATCSRTLSDRATLEALPAGTLGRTYADFVAASRSPPTGSWTPARRSAAVAITGGERRLFGDRLRDMHDLLARGHRLRPRPGRRGGAARVQLRADPQPRRRLHRRRRLAQGRPRPVRRLIVDGYRRGRRAAWLPALGLGGAAVAVRSTTCAASSTSRSRRATRPCAPPAPRRSNRTASSARRRRTYVKRRDAGEPPALPSAARATIGRTPQPDGAPCLVAAALVAAWRRPSVAGW